MVQAGRRLLAGLLALIGCVVLSLCSSPAPAAEETRDFVADWSWPVPGARVVERSFVAPRTPYGTGHRGIDIPAAEGTTLIAPAPVRVAFSGDVVDRHVVTLDAGDGWLLSFDAADSDFAVGTVIQRGGVWGRVALTPHCDCVHVGLRYRGDYVNPLLKLGIVPRAVLLPW